jgi:hypothetical protein
LTIAFPSLPVSNQYAIGVDNVDASEWHARLGDFDDASIYHTWAYGEAHWSAGQLSHLTLERDGRTVAMAQVRLLRLPLLSKGIAYIRWGPLCRLRGQPLEVEVLKQMTAALKEEYVNRRGLFLRILPAVFEADPFASSCTAIWSALGLKKNEKARLYRTVRLGLERSLEDLRKGLNAKWRNKLNGAERNDLSISEGIGPEFYERFMSVYGEMMARKHFETTVDVAEFQQMQQQLPSDLKMRIFLCEKAGKVLNALVVSAIGDTAIYLLGATSDEGLKLKGAYLLQWRAIQWLKERGCRWYDLGGIDPVRNPGVYEFKSGFGGQETEHSGTYDLSDRGLSALCISAGERLQTVAHRLRSALNRKTLREQGDRNPVASVTPNPRQAGS